MNPWQSLRREVDGAVRSFRYDLSLKQAKRAMRRETVYLPLVRRRRGRDRRRFCAVAAAVLLPVAGVSGYLAVTSGIDALFPGEGAPNGLPGANLDRNSPGPSPAGPEVAQPVAIEQPQRRRPAPRTSPVPTLLPTPVPSCLCTSTPPPPTPAPTPPPQSPSPSPVTSASPWPTISTPPSGSPSPRFTWRLMP